MTRVRLVHWNEDEARRRVAQLEAVGCSVEFEPLPDQESMRRLGETAPEAILIDLSRLPAQGRDLGIWLRQRTTTRNVPLVFLGGAPDKVERIRSLLPDATYAGWEGVDRAVAAALSNPPSDPVVPESAFPGYSDTPLPKKLGIKPGFTVALVGAPEDFDMTLGSLPEGAQLRPSGRGKRDLTVCFVTSRRDLTRRVAALVRASEQGHVWIAWPKKTSGIDTDLTQAEVRRTGLDSGLVDFKICAIDETWSGLCFALRRS